MLTTIKAKPEKSGDAKPSVRDIRIENTPDGRVAEMPGIFYGLDVTDYYEK